MTSTRSRRVPGGVAAGTAATLAAAIAGADAHASGFQLREQSAAGQGTSFAGATARADDLSTIFYNPAGMTRLSGNQTEAVISYIAPSAEFDGSASFGGRPVSGGTSGDAVENAFVPAGYLFWDFSPDLKFGLAMNSPFGLRTEYDDDWIGRYQTLESSITNITLTPSVAYRVTDRLSLGGGLQIAYTDVTLSQAVNLSGFGLPDGKGEVRGSAFGFGFDIGALYEITPQTRIGVNWRSQINQELDGDVDYDNVPAAISNLVPALRDTGGKADLRLPDTVSLGVYHEVSPQWAVMADVAWTNWSTFKEVRVRHADDRPDTVTTENWDDTWFFALGTTYKPTERHTLRLGVAYDQTPVSDTYRTARIPDSDRYWLSAGFSYEFEGGNAINLGYTHIFADQADVDKTTPTGGTLRGSYDAHVDIVAASFTLKF